MRDISILIPTFNDLCLAQVEALQAQAALIDGFRYEIIVADDGSTDRSVVEGNRAIGLLPHCAFIELPENVGRSAVRNFLGARARYEWLLFLDCGVRPLADDFLRRYACCDCEADVVCGGMRTEDSDGRWSRNLRFRYERAMEGSFSAARRAEKGFRSFRTNNFLIRKATFEKVKFDENIRTYGYEDVLFGKQLMLSGARIGHIGNEVAMSSYEGNLRFLEKTEESLCTLKAFAGEIGDFSSLLLAAKRIRGLRLGAFMRFLFFCAKPLLRSNLLGGNPRPRLYALYKIGYFLSL